MAIMIPAKPRMFEPASLENIMFSALEQLSDEYYVFHSFRITNVSDNTFHESETDFVIYNRMKGIICLEAKAGQVHYSYGEWLYGNGIPMHNDGPFNQASSNKHKLRRHISNSKMSGLLDHCKFLHAVWFPSITNDQLKSMKLPAEADRRIVLTKEALLDPGPFLEQIYSIDICTRNGNMETSITENESVRLIKEILCPEFEIFPTASFESDLKKIVFHKLLKEQAGVLNFLEDQKTAVINGAAGTGKTMIAVKKAIGHADNGEKVLFLCFNVKLKEYLESTFAHDNISYYTIAGLSCKLCNSTTPDYQRTKERLEDMYISASFPYKHVIIDEGQDFGNEIIEEADIIRLLYDIIIDQDGLGGSFYIFYDKLQLIQAKAMPELIDELDCRLTLYRNCRNTESIAITSLKPVSERKPKLFEDAIKGVPAKIHFCGDDIFDRIDNVIASVKADGLSNIVILTCKTMDASILSEKTKDGKYRNKYLFTTVRKYKGLEADAVILIDIDKETFNEDNVLLYYVGASRARLRLDIITSMSDDDCIHVLEHALRYKGKIKKPKRDLASALYTVGSLND